VNVAKKTLQACFGSHAASAFLASPFESCAIITVDGVGEWTTTAIYHGTTTADGSAIEKVKELHFPHSIGLLYSALTAYLGFRVNEGEYKVMGLAAYGTPRYLDKMRELCSVGEDGSLKINTKYFSYHRHPTRSFTPALEKLLGPPRTPGGALNLPAQTDDDARFADVAASLQTFTEEYMLTLAREAARVTGENRLAMAGGVALNSVANQRILSEGPFENVFVQPAAGDSGGALGAALYVTHVLCKVPRRLTKQQPFLGQAWATKDVVNFLKDCGVRHRAFDSRAELCDTVSALLVQGEVGGWFQGRFEWGPRALGGRSIIADARRHDMRDRVNQKVKFREGFRPFAPAVLAEEMQKWFTLPTDREEHMTPYMCCVAPVTPEAKATLPAVVHVDGTARVQSVDAATNPVFHQLLTAFKKRTDVGVILNTSMNLKDEPICGSPAEAYATFMRSDLDFLVLENCLVAKRDLP